MRHRILFSFLIRATKHRRVRTGICVVRLSIVVRPAFAACDLKSIVVRPASRLCELEYFACDIWNLLFIFSPLEYFIISLVLCSLHSDEMLVPRIPSSFRSICFANTHEILASYFRKLKYSARYFMVHSLAQLFRQFSGERSQLIGSVDASFFGIFFTNMASLSLVFPLLFTTHLFFTFQLFFTLNFQARGFSAYNGLSRANISEWATQRTPTY